MKPQLHAAKDVGVHRVADHRGLIRARSLRAARIMNGLGLPTLKALTPAAVSSIATIAPQPGRSPSFVGQFGSRLVATSFAPRRSILTAASTNSRLKVRPSPTTT